MPFIQRKKLNLILASKKYSQDLVNYPKLADNFRTPSLDTFQKKLHWILLKFSWGYNGLRNWKGQKDIRIRWLVDQTNTTKISSDLSYQQ